MDKQMYELVKQALKNGKTTEDLAVEFGAMAAAAQKELEPKSAIYESMVDPDFIKKTQENILVCGVVREDALINLIAIWLCQHSFIPDKIYRDKKEFLADIGLGLKSNFEAFAKTGKFIDKLDSGAFDKELGEILTKQFGPIFDIFFPKKDSTNKH